MQWIRWGALAAGAAVLVSVMQASGEIIKAGKPAPAWSAKTVEGKAISSARFKGKPVLMNFFNYY
jgi:hypothetical protein